MNGMLTVGAGFVVGMAATVNAVTSQSPQAQHDFKAQKNAIGMGFAGIATTVVATAVGTRGPQSLGVVRALHTTPALAGLAVLCGASFGAIGGALFGGAFLPSH